MASQLPSLRCKGLRLAIGTLTRRGIRGWLEFEALLCNRLHFCARIENGEVLSTSPERIEIPIVRIVDVTGLAWGVQTDGVIPVFGIHNDFEGPASNLIVTAGGHGDGIAVPAARQVTDVEFLAQLRA